VIGVWRGLRRGVFLATLSIGATISTNAFADNCVSVAAGGNWNVAATWTACVTGNGSTPGTPGAADTATITTTDPGVVVLTVAETVGSLTINHSVAGNVALNLTGANLTVTSLLTLTSGVVTTNALDLIVAGDCTTSVSRTAGWVDGNLRLTFATGAVTCAYPLGDSTSYAPISIAKTGTNTGTLSGTVVIGDHTDVTRGVAGINSNKSVNLAWTLTPVTLSANTPYGATFTYSATDTDAAATVGSMILRKKPLNTNAKTPGPWLSPTLTGAVTATTLVSSGLQTFGIFAIGEALTTGNKAPFVHFRERY